jgi:hypothetical protein
MRDSLIEFLLIEMRPRPGMYLTANSLSYLEIFLTGVQITCWQLDKTGVYSESFFGEDGFLQWSWRKYKLGHPSHRLHHYLEFAKGDDKLALELFFGDLQAYQSESSR